MFCGNCGNEVQQNDKFCRGCGYKIEKNESNISPDTSTPLSEDQKHAVNAITLEALQYNKKGDDFFDAENYEEALLCFNKAVELEPTNGEFWKNKGAVLEELEKSEDALVCYDKAVQLEPTNGEFWKTKGLMLQVQNKSEEALQCFDKAVELEPTNARAWAYKGMSESELGRNEEASIHMDKASELDPSDAEITMYKVGLNLSNRMDKTIEKQEKRSNVLEELEKKINRVVDQQSQRIGDATVGNVLQQDQEYNHYEILGVPTNASQEEIQRRFRELSLKFHPDKETSSLSQQTMKQIIEAYNTLKDSQKRKEYDDILQLGS